MLDAVIAADMHAEATARLQRSITARNSATAHRELADTRVSRSSL